MTNLPERDSGDKVCGVFKQPGLIHIVNSNGYIIERVHYNPDYPEGLATTIAGLITDARDAGYKQCQASIRAALGVC